VFTDLNTDLSVSWLSDARQISQQHSGEFLVAFSFAYDWLHGAWESSERGYIIDPMTKFGLEKGVSVYARNVWFL
jgi:hypothetical protein